MNVRSKRLLSSDISLEFHLESHETNAYLWSLSSERGQWSKKDTAHTSIMRVMTRYLKKDPIYNANPMKVRRGKIAKVVGFPCEQEAFLLVLTTMQYFPCRKCSTFLKLMFILYTRWRFEIVFCITKTNPFQAKKMAAFLPAVGSLVSKKICPFWRPCYDDLRRNKCKFYFSIKSPHLFRQSKCVTKILYIPNTKP